MAKDQDTTKKKTTKPAAKKPASAAAHKPRAVKKTEVAAHAAPHAAPHSAPVEAVKEVKHEPAGKHAKPSGKYVFATGRRKTAVATVRIFNGAGEHTVNKKPFTHYFFHHNYRDAALKAFELTGTLKDFHFTATVLGGGINAQAHALQHGLARALAQVNPEVHTVLKRNGLLTRDDRKKERKKPGLKRARRSPQWAKR